MLFNSYIFLFVFLPVTLVLYFVLGRRSLRAAVIFLGLASLVFYGWWRLSYVPILIVSILFNFAFGVLVSRARKRRTFGSPKALVVVAISGNLLLLCYYKYFNFLLQNVGVLLDTSIDPYLVALPLGISFFTFTQISFLVDTYNGKAKEYDFPRYLLFVSYFPHLIAGPILHHGEMMPQFARASNARFQADNFATGIAFFAIGLFKKVVIADHIVPYSDIVFSSATEVHLTIYEAWLGALAYSCQIYFDFSGYSDMAVGLARMMNIRLPYNFSSPYRAKNIIEFWRCWHMTLSRFLRDYLYIPLGGNRRGDLRRYANLMTTMLLGGLWHGAGWGLVIWGGLHGVFLSVNHLVSGIRLPFGAGFWRGVTFLSVTTAWVFFRAPSMDSAFSVLGPMFFFNGISMPNIFSAERLQELISAKWLHFDGMFHNGLFDPIAAIIAVVAALIVAFAAPNSQQILDRVGERQPSWPSAILWTSSVARGAVLGAALAVSLTLMGGETPFLYFQF